MTENENSLEIGRPSKKTEQRVEALLQSLRAGASRQRAAALAGIHRDTLYEWMKQDPAFSDAIEKAEAFAEFRFLARVATAAENERSWQAAAWILERRFPNEWRRREGVEISGAEGKAIEVKTSADPAADAARLAATLGLLEQLGVVSRPDSTILITGETESDPS
ncbi:hypothetical protein UFOVP1336_21 [uncultured Caudovirales phage]|uniref:Uncharacterized protein n=1 Tax=uncultured Caudovirales phage TaxID=2100421 RepID=A0A6J5RPE1_9CAUD|nr:hypothetical protein UFOVP1336_21 [uncultured Caudovirales phage]